MLEIRDLHVKFHTRDREAVAGLSLSIQDGEIVGLVGESGSGKSVTAMSVAGLLPRKQCDYSGEILLDGHPADPKKDHIAYIFQGNSTMPWLTVEQNVAFGLDIRHTPKKEKKELTDRYLEIVGLTKYRKYYPKQLSASMLQRVSIARAFATEPELLLMDEPYGQLDIELRFKLEDELVRLWQMTGTTVIFITHNIEEAVYLGENIMILTNKPTTVKERLANRLPRPRDIAAPEFVRLREQVTDLIRWW